MELSAEELYEKILNQGYTKEELESELRSRIQSSQGYLSMQGAVMEVARDIGMIPRTNAERNDNDNNDWEGYEDFLIPISDIIEEGTQGIVLLGRIVKVLFVKAFMRADQTQGKVGSFLLQDKTSTIRIVAWDDNATIIGTDYFSPGEPLCVVGGYSKLGREGDLEVHLGKKGKLVLSPENIDESALPKFTEIEDANEATSDFKYSKKIAELEDYEGFLSEVQGEVIFIFPLKELTKKDGEMTFLLTFTVQDDSGRINVKAWGLYAVETLKKIEIGQIILLKNVLVKFNEYSQEKEIIFTKTTSFSI